MPNHVLNIIKTSPEVASALMRPLTEEDISQPWDKREPGTLIVDFKLIIPPPDTENYNSDSCSHSHPWGRNRGDADPNADCWYPWNSENWGTKWNAYESGHAPSAGDLAVVEFQTAWAHPFPVIIALSKRFPEEELEVRFADEDLGSNLGSYVMKNGEITKEVVFDDDNRPEDFACRMWFDQSYEEYLKDSGALE